jgi:hypothetical protein
VQEAMMKTQLTAVAICFGILYAVDAMFFNGWYFAVTHQVIDRAWTFGW